MHATGNQQRSSPIKTVTIHFVLGCIALGAVFDVSPVAAAQIRTLRIVTYNIEDDINGATTPLPGLIAPPANTTNVQAGGVLEGIGEEIPGSDLAQPLDVLALQETTGNTITVAPIVNGLNSFYNAPGMYAMSPHQATESDGDVADGNGPNALVYNTKTLQLLASVAVDPPGGTSKLGSSSGELREVMRYELAPAGITPTATNEFYVYVSHYKSSSSGIEATNQLYRNEEAVIIRNDEANNLPANARLLYVGDYNVTTSGEASYQTILSNTAPNGIQQGQGIDPLNPSAATSFDWSANSNLSMKTDSSTSLHYRDDLQVMTTNVYFGVAGGLALIPGTYHVFGNNGTTPYKGTVNSGSNTALNSDLASGALISASQLYLDLTDASDHLPVVADYTIPITVPAPVLQSVTGTGGTVTFTWSAVASAVYQLQYRTNLVQGDWSNLGSAITATNAVMSASDSIGPDPQRFYRLLAP
jgi:hypothetical protein